MKAALCTHYGPPEELEVKDVPSPRPGKGQVVVTVRACGVNFPDVLLIQDKYQFKPALPFAPGGEIAGIVKEAGEGVTNPKPGDAVIASIGHGGFAEEALADAARCIAMPEGLDYAVASSFFITYGTSWHALRDRAVLKSGETLVVLGAAGGVGLAAVEIGHAIGARVIVGASSADKLALAAEHGADLTLDYATRDVKEGLRALTEGRGADVIYDPVGGDLAEPALRAIAWQGRYLVVGFAAGTIPKIPLNLALLKGCDIQGVFWGSFVEREPATHRANMDQIFVWTKEGKLS